jgi:predicted metal-binding membrane protein
VVGRRDARIRRLAVVTLARRTTWGGLPIWALAVSAWGLILLGFITGQGRLLDHHAILGSGEPPALSDLLLFVAAWQVMTAAMMLPSSIPMIRRFSQISRGQSRPRLILGVFVAAYFVVWTGFAVVVLPLDASLHALVDHWAWLGANPRLIGGAIFLGAGLFQFSPLKERCLMMCRSPQSFLWSYYQRGVRAAWALGVRHGLFCLGCCWALMLVMFGVGVGSIIWLVILTEIMVIEKTTWAGRLLAPVVGAGLIVFGLVVASGVPIPLPIPVSYS